MASAKSTLTFFVGAMLAYVVSSYVAGFIGIGLGEAQYYPPSSNALSFLREIPSQSVVFPAAILHGLLLGFVFYPFRKRVLELGRLYGCLAMSSVIFVIGELIASLDQSVYYVSIPLGYYVVVAIELLIQALLFGQLMFAWEKRFNRIPYAISVGGPK
ncbi:MAG: hypothetical protein OK438_01015 [Thaumarchaeota archaeon]|nr:hypothetical protein [Nitrososphaerota archaeon]